MNRQETLKIMAVIRATYQNFYKDISRNDVEQVVALWQDMFAEDDYRIVAAAVKSFIVSDDKGFPPVIGQIKEKIKLITEVKDLTEAEAWNMVVNAIRNGLYGYKEEFAKLPESVQHCVGSSSQLREWAMMDSETIHSVVASNFQRSFRAKQKSEKEYAALPPEVKKLVDEAAGMLQIGE